MVGVLFITFLIKTKNNKASSADHVTVTLMENGKITWNFAGVSFPLNNVQMYALALGLPLFHIV